MEKILKELKINFKCDKCGKTNLSKFKFNSYPEILIIIFENSNNINYKFKYESDIKIKDSQIEVIYELIGIIVGNNNTLEKRETIKKDRVRKVVSFFKSSIDKTWRKCSENKANIQKEALFKYLNENNNNYSPILLIFQKENQSKNNNNVFDLFMNYLV